MLDSVANGKRLPEKNLLILGVQSSHLFSIAILVVVEVYKPAC